MEWDNSQHEFRILSQEATTMRKYQALSIMIAAVFSVLTVGEVWAECRSSKKDKEMSSMGCCKMKGMDMGESQEHKTDQGSHGDMQMEGMDCCMTMDMKKDMQNMPGMGAGEEKSPASGRVIQSHHVKDLTIVVLNGRGQFNAGQNSFCIEFRKAQADGMAEAGDVQVEFTMAMGRTEAMRAVSHVTQAGLGRYCGHVNLSMAGPWSVRVKYDGPSGKGQTVFNVAVK